MGQYIELAANKTWYEVEGEGEPLVLLHGGLCTNETWQPQRADFAAKHRIFLPERRAHGHTPDVAGPLSFDDMAKDTIDFIDTVVREPAHLVGWSDGGIVALLVAIARPDLVRKMVVIGTNFLPASSLPGGAEMLDHMDANSPNMAMFRSMYEASTPDGADNWGSVVKRIVDMWRIEPNITTQQLASLALPTLVVTGDDDLVNLEHTIDLYRGMPDSQLAIVPGASHVLLMEKPAFANQLILDFIDNDPVKTMFPIRRAQQTSSA